MGSIADPRDHALAKALDLNREALDYLNLGRKNDAYQCIRESTRILFEALQPPAQEVVA